MKKQRGQALITLLFFTLIAVTVTAGSVAVLFSNALSATRFQEGSIAYGIAQSGIDNAILRLLRDPNYTGEVIAIDGGSVAVQVVYNGGSSYTITSKGTIGNLLRQIQVSVTYNNSLLTITSRKEVF